MKLTLVVVFLVFASLASASSSNCFVWGVESAVPFPPTGYTSVTLDKLNGELGSAFISQYNSFGIPFLPNLTAVNCIATFGPGNCAYPSSTTSSDMLVPFNNGTKQCIWSNPPGPVKLGTWYSLMYYNTLNASAISSWTTTTCNTGAHYTLLYNSAMCGNNPPTPPPSSGYTCCFYFSHPENFQTSVCQKSGLDCPEVSGFTLVYNQTASSCADCTVTKQKYSIQLDD